MLWAGALAAASLSSGNRPLPTSLSPFARYAVREDSANTQLRAGAVAAFALVRAAGGFDLLQRAAAAGGGGGGGGGLEQLLSLDVVGPAALYAGQCMLAFGFAAAALEFAFSSGAIQRMRGSAMQ